MITTKDLGIVRRLFYRDGLSISEIERRTGLTRKTISKWLNALERTEPKYQRRIAEDTKIAPFAAQLIKALVKAFVPLRFELGEAFQFDWSEERLLVGGVWRKILVAHLKLCASRAFVLQAYPTQSHEMLFDAHTRSSWPWVAFPGGAFTTTCARP